MNRKLNLSWLMWLSSLLLLPHPVVPSNSRSLPALGSGRFVVSHTPSRFLPESLSLETWAQRFWPTKGLLVVLGLCRRSQTRARIVQPLCKPSASSGLCANHRLYFCKWFQFLCEWSKGCSTTGSLTAEMCLDQRLTFFAWNIHF